MGNMGAQHGVTEREWDDGLRPNALGFSGGAPLDRERTRAVPSFQKSPDLAGAKRRPLQAPVGRQPMEGFVMPFCHSSGCPMIVSTSVRVIACHCGLKNRPCGTT